MRHLSIALVLCAFTASCKKDSVALGPEPARPAELMGVLSLPIGMDLSDYTLRLNALGIPAGLALGPMETGMKTLCGELVKNPDDIDYKKPMSLLVLGTPNATPQLVLIAHGKKTLEPKSDKIKLEAKSSVAIAAPADRWDAVSAYARYVARAPMPAAPRVRVFPKAIATTYAQKIEEGMAEVQRQLASTGSDLTKIVDMYRVMGRALAEHTEWVDMRLGKEDAPLLTFALAPRAGTDLEKFILAQTPHAFNLSGRLPPVENMFMYMEGSMHIGPYLEPMLSFVDGFFPESLASAYKEMAREAAKVMTGDMVGVLSMDMPTALADPNAVPKMEMVYLMKTTASLDASFRKLFSSWPGGPMNIMGMKQEASFKLDVAKVGDHAVHEWLIKSEMPQTGQHMEQTIHLATTPDWILFEQVMGEGKKPNLEPLYIASQGKPPALTLSKPMMDALARAKSTKQSFVMLMDLAAMMKQKIPLAAFLWTFGADRDAKPPELQMTMDLR
jgi:hypothetical protein